MDHCPLSTTLVVSAESAATRSARAVVRELCSDARVRTDTAETAVLLTTELVSNALEHGGGTAVLDAAVVDQRLCVEVVDDDPTIPTVNLGAVDDERGRGLMLVEALSSRWGAALRDRGKTVWFELDLASPAP